MRAFLILIFTAFLLSRALAQNISEMETESYFLFSQGKWDELIAKGEQAIKDKQDSYLLHYRLGIARYEKKQYLKAIRHFNKIYKEGKADPVLNEYLYFSWFFAGFYNEAMVYYNQLSKESVAKYGLKKYPLLSDVVLEVEQSQNLENDARFTNNLMGSANLYGEVEWPDNYKRSRLTAKFQPWNSQSFTFSFGGLVARNNFLVEESQWEWPRELFAIEKSFYFSTTHTFKNHVSLSASMHQISGTYSSSVFSYDSLWQGSLGTSHTNYSDAAYSLGIKKHAGKYIFLAEGNYNDIGNQKSAGFALCAVRYPFQGFPLFVQSNFIVQKQIGQKGKNKTSDEIIVKPVVGYQGKKFGISAYTILGNIKYYSISNALFVYNSPDPVVFLAGANLYLNIGKSLTFTLGGNYFEKQTQRMVYTDADKYTLEKINYFNLLTTGGFVWNF